MRHGVAAGTQQGSRHLAEEKRRKGARDPRPGVGGTRGPRGPALQGEEERGRECRGRCGWMGPEEPAGAPAEGQSAGGTKGERALS